MLRIARFALTAVILTSLACLPAGASRVLGEVTDVTKSTIIATFPVPVQARAMMTVLSGDGDAVAGVAIAQNCRGDKPPYEVEGSIYFSTDAVNLRAGKKVYVNSINAMPAPSSTPRPTVHNSIPTARDLRLYYYAAGQTVGYGAVGIGYERTLKLSRGLGIQLDGGIATVGNVSAGRDKSVNADQLIKSLNGRVNFDFTPGFGAYTGYRWCQGRGDAQRWGTLSRRLQGHDFVASSNLADGTVETQGIEYGLSLRPGRWLSLAAGYIPGYRADYGSFGVITQPAYTGELRFGLGDSAVRLRGVSARDYWVADIGIGLR